MDLPAIAMQSIAGGDWIYPVVKSERFIVLGLKPV